MRGSVGFALRTAFVFLAVTAGGVAGGVVLYRGVEPSVSVDSEAFQNAMVAVNAVHAAMLALLASGLRARPLRAMAILFVLFFGVHGVLTSMETAYFVFNGSLDLELVDIHRGLAASAVTALVGAAAAALMFRTPEAHLEPAAQARAVQPWRLGVAVALYPVVYWVAGLSIALPSDAVTEFYADSIANIDPAALLALQVLRGAIWAGLAYVAVRGLGGPPLARAALVGAAFAVFMAAQLLYPNDVMPPDVRWVHFVELIISNFIYGLAAALLLFPRRRPAKVVNADLDRAARPDTGSGEYGGIFDGLPPGPPHS